MSGGAFDYATNTDTINTLKKEILCFGKKYNKETITKFNKCLKLLEEADVYVHRIDWLISGDDGEDNFKSRLKEDLKELKETYKPIEPLTIECKNCQQEYCTNKKNNDKGKCPYFFPHDDFDYLDLINNSTK